MPTYAPRPLVAAGPHPDRDLLPGLDVETDLGSWSVHETPGHAPSHVVLFQRERRLLISGDHLLGRVSLCFDYGYTPDPVGEFLGSLDAGRPRRAPRAVRPRTPVRRREGAHRRRRLVELRLDAVRAALQDGPSTAFDLLPAIYGEDFTATWWAGC